MAQTDERTGIASPIATGVGQFASFRWAQTQHALLYGPTMTHKNRMVSAMAKTLFSPRAADDEMQRIRAGATWGQRGLLNRTLGSKGRELYGSWGNSPFMAAKWTTSAQLMSNPDRYTSQAYRMFSDKGFINNRSQNYRVGKSGGGGRAQGFVRRFEDAGYMKNPGSMAYATEMNPKLARRWTSKALRFGMDYVDDMEVMGAGHNAVLDFMTGVMFKPGSGKEMETLQWAAAAGKNPRLYEGGASRIGQKLASKANLGKGIRVLGEASEFGLTKTGAAVGAIAKVGGAAIGAANIALTAYQVTDLAYNLGEAYFYKLPKRGFDDLTRMGTRGMFSPVGPQGWISSQTATSNRQRAVQAIQSSKMNARSALGSEASLLAGHFG